MNLNDHQRLMLRAIVTQGSGKAKQFTHGVTSISPRILTLYLDKMVDGGLLDLEDSVYTPTQAGRIVIAGLDSMTPPRTLCNASSTGTYRPTWASVRPGADDHKQYASLTPFRG